MTDLTIEHAELMLERKERLRIRHNSSDPKPVQDDIMIHEQATFLLPLKTARPCEDRTPHKPSN